MQNDNQCTDYHIVVTANVYHLVRMKSNHHVLCPQVISTFISLLTKGVEQICNLILFINYCVPIIRPDCISCHQSEGARLAKSKISLIFSTHRQWHTFVDHWVLDQWWHISTLGDTLYLVLEGMLLQPLNPTISYMVMLTVKGTHF